MFVCWHVQGTLILFLNTGRLHATSVAGIVGMATMPTVTAHTQQPRHGASHAGWPASHALAFS